MQSLAMQPSSRPRYWNCHRRLISGICARHRALGHNGGINMGMRKRLDIWLMEHDDVLVPSSA